MKCEKCGKISDEVHVCNDIFGQFYICYECATLKTIGDVKREVEIIRNARETKPT
jgi:protein-arginine kinase activator protein McsA